MKIKADTIEELQDIWKEKMKDFKIVKPIYLGFFSNKFCAKIKPKKV